MSIHKPVAGQRLTIWGVALVAMLALTALFSASSAQAVWKANGTTYTGSGQSFWGEGSWSITLKRSGGGGTTEIVGCVESTSGKIKGPYEVEGTITLNSCKIVGGPTCTVKPVTIKVSGTIAKLTSESFKLVSTGECLYPEIPMQVNLYPTFGAGGKTLSLSMTGVDTFKILGTWTFAGTSTWGFSGEHAGETFEVAVPTYSPKLEIGSLGKGNGQFYAPTAVAVEPGGGLWVGDFELNRMQQFSASTGSYITQFGSTGSGNGQFNGTGQAARDASGNLYVSDANRVQKFTSSGTYVSQFGTFGTGNGQFSGPWGIAIDPATGHIFVADVYNNRVQEFDSSGTYVSQFGTTGTGNGQFKNPYGLAFNRAGNLLVVDTGNCRVQEFKTSGSYQAQFGTCGTGDGQFSSPYGIATDLEGNSFVTDSGNRRVQIFNAKNAFVQKFGTAGTKSGQFSNVTTGIAIDPSGNAYIADWYNHRVDKWGF
jgi:sugar lactone lactonase YvrE